jgi:uncharacterized RDD family membrane protein YckC
VVVLIAGSSDGEDQAAAWFAIVGGLPAVIAFVWCVFDDRRRMLHDRMSGTVCVRGRPVSPPQRFTRV